MSSALQLSGGFPRRLCLHHSVKTLALTGVLVRRQREEELKQVFRSYDSDHDGNLDLAEFTRIVTDVDTSAAAGLSSIFVAEQ